MAKTNRRRDANKDGEGCVSPNTGIFYSEEMLEMLRKRSEDILSGKEPTYPLKESMARIMAQRKHIKE